MTGESLDILANNLTQLRVLFPQVFIEGENIFIEGENLIVLKLLQKAYYNKIKCIIIDPSYKTGNDSFIYPDSFKEFRSEYEKRVGDKDEDGQWMKEGLFRKNSKDSGHFHSNWISMMYPWLFLARNLLTDDGVIFVHIDDNKVHNLRLLMNKVFGEENFISSLICKSRQNVDSRSQNGVSNDHEYILCFSKNSTSLRGRKSKIDEYKNPDNNPRGFSMNNSILGLATVSQRPNLHYELLDPSTNFKYAPPPETDWRYSKETISRKIAKNRIVFPSNPVGRPRERKFLSELESRFTGFSSILSTDLGFTLNGTRELREIRTGNYFPFPKPVFVVRAIVEQGLLFEENRENIILDFFAGSGTTGQAGIELESNPDFKNIKFITVQMPELCDVKSEAFLAGFKSISEIARVRIKKVLRKYSNNLCLKSFKLPDSNFKLWRGKEKPQRALMIDECFKNNDQLKTNTVLQMKDAGVEFKTI